MKNIYLLKIITALITALLLSGCNLHNNSSKGSPGSSTGAGTEVTNPADRMYKLSLYMSEDGNKKGKIITEVDAQGYKAGTEVIIQARPEAGSFFWGWCTKSIDGYPIYHQANYKLTIKGDTTLYAKFEKNREINFPDPAMESAVRREAYKPTGQLYYSDVFWLTKFSNYVEDGRIKNLSGIERP